VAFVLNPNLLWDDTIRDWTTVTTERTKSNTPRLHTFSDSARFRDVDLGAFKHLVGQNASITPDEYTKEKAFMSSTVSVAYDSNVEGKFGLKVSKLALNDLTSNIFISGIHLLALVFRRIHNTISDFATLRNSTKTIRQFQAVITIPTHFDAAQQETILQAASLAGFARVGLLRDCTAARAAYQFSYIPRRLVKSSAGDTILFVDIGYSSSIAFVVVSTSDDMIITGHKISTSLGVRDMDLALAAHFGKNIMAIHGFDILSVPHAHSYLLQECSKAREKLMYSKEALLTISLSQFKLEHQMSISFETLHAVISSFIDDTFTLIQDALIEAHLAHAGIRTVVLLGDVAPLYKPRIMDKFPGVIARSLDDFWRAKTALRSWTSLRRTASEAASDFWIDHTLESSTTTWKIWKKDESRIESITSRVNGIKISEREARGNTSGMDLGGANDLRAFEPTASNVTSIVLGSTADMARIDDDIKNSLATLERMSEANPERSDKCNTLCALYLEKYSCTQDVRVASSALVWAVKALGDVDYRSPDARPELVSNVATCLKYKYDHSKDLQTLNMCILYQSYVVKALPENDTKPAHAGYLINYGTFLQTRGDHLGDSSDLVDGAKHLQRAIGLLTTSTDPADHPRLIAAVINLGNTLQILYKSTGTLDDLYNTIHCHEITLSLLTNKDAERSAALSRMGFAMMLHHQHFGNAEGVDKAVGYFREALEYVSDEHPSKPLYLSGYAGALTALYRRSNEAETINHAIEIHRKIMNLRKQDHPNRAVDMDKFASLYAERFESTKDLNDLDEAVNLHQSALSLTKEDQLTLKFTFLNNLGTTLKTRFEYSKAKEDSVQCISALESALDYAEYGAARAKTIYNLAHAYFEVYTFGKDNNQRLKCIELCKEVVSSLAPLSVRFNAAGLWTQAAISSTNGQVALEATTTMVDLLSQLAWPGLSLSSQISVLRFANQVACNAAAIALHFKDPYRALEWLEQGRTVSWNQLLHMRSPLLELKAQEPELAEKIIELSRQLDVGERKPEASLTQKEEASKSSMTFTKNPVALEREKLLQKARAIPGLERLMMAKNYSDFHIGTYDGPVVVVNVSQYRCDALIISNGRAPFHLPLPTFSLQQAEYLKTRMLKTLHNSARLQRSVQVEDEEFDDSDAGAGMRYGRPRRVKPTNESIDADFRYILKELYDHIVEPIANCLGIAIAFDEDLPHIWWCLTGPLTFLPLHAAGIYAADNDHETARISILDYAVSSYIPSISALHNIMYKKSARPPFKMLSVIQSNTPGQQPLPATLIELDIIRKSGMKGGLSEDMDVLQGDKASCGAVMEGMKTHSWIHLACHGKQDVHEPTKSGLHLHDSTLLLEDIVKVALPNADFAFLSACQTASGDASHPDEAVHLAAGMLMAGYNSVIASMWSIGDSDAAVVAEDVYDFLFEEGTIPDSRKAARALHRAVRNLRTRHTGRHGGSKFLAWLPYIHVGM
ncbi:hypothetical protein CVT25_006607, partial [Psilocybe cyanescens]